MQRNEIGRRDFQSSPNNRGRYQHSGEYNDRNFDQHRSTDNRIMHEDMSYNRGGNYSSGRGMRGRNQRDDHPRGYHDDREGRRDSRGEYFRDQEPYSQIYENRTVKISQREQISLKTGIPKDLIKSDIATQHGVNYQAKPSELRYHFYIICLDCKNTPVPKIKDNICVELGKLGYKLNKEAIYIDDREYENDYKALVGLKFDHKALECFDNSNRMKLQFRFRTELSRTFAAYMEKYGDAIRTMAYPSDPMMGPNQKIEQQRGKY